MALVLVFIAAAIQVLVPYFQMVIFQSDILGASVSIAGFAIMLAGWAQFRQGGLNICPTANTAFLLTSGIYRYTRNPMYLGILMILFGLAIVIGTVPFYRIFGIYSVIINNVFCPYEEQKLLNKFGADYQLYISKVNRWF